MDAFYFLTSDVCIKSTGDFFYVVGSGSLECILTLEHDEPRVVKQYCAGEVFGELGKFSVACRVLFLAPLTIHLSVTILLYQR